MFPSAEAVLQACCCEVKASEWFELYKYPQLEACDRVRHLVNFLVHKDWRIGTEKEVAGRCEIESSLDLEF